MTLQRNLLLAVLAVNISLVCCANVQSRNQWDINHGGNNPPPDGRLVPGGSLSGYVPQFKGDFWTGGTGKVQAGTILTAILEDTISSGKSKPGDTFTLTLQDGYSINGKISIPPNSKIVGSVNSVTPARTLQGGHPGRLQVSLQSLILPDGRHLPLSAFIDSNSNLTRNGPPKKQALGYSISSYGQSFASSLMTFVRGPGFMMRKMNRGLDFTMTKGEVVPVRLTRGLQIPENVRSLAVQQGGPNGNAPAPDYSGQPVPGMVQPQMSQAGSAAPGLVPGGTQYGGGVPGMVDPSGPVQYPARQQPAQQYQPPPQRPVDPNEVFKQSLTPPAPSNMPDPF